MTFANTDDFTVEYERSIAYTPPEAGRNSYIAYVRSRDGREPPEPVTITFDEGDFYHKPCDMCFVEKCWLVEPAALIEHVAEYGSDQPYEHCCTCACHEAVPLPREDSVFTDYRWEDDLVDDDYGECVDKNLSPS